MAMKTNRCVEGNLPHELRDMLQTLAENWGDVIDSTTLLVDQLRGGMTNEVYRISWPIQNQEFSRRDVLVRLYGEGVELFFNRDHEIQTFECMSRLGFGPRLLGQFPRGRVEEFIHARTLSADDFRDTGISSLIASKVRELHELDMPLSKNVVLWDRLRSWLSVAKRICSVEHTQDFRLDELDCEIKMLENEFPFEQTIGFCHNDLQYGNIMIDDKNRLLTLIDYEYASYNPVAYDIANHFCEMAADYSTETPHILDYSKYPGLEERHRFIREYLSYSGHEPNEGEIEKILVEAEKYSLASHLCWGLWGIISAYVNNIEFDYLEYARQRLRQYWVKKIQLSSV